MSENVDVVESDLIEGVKRGETLELFDEEEPCDEEIDECEGGVNLPESSTRRVDREGVIVGKAGQSFDALGIIVS